MNFDNLLDALKINKKNLIIVLILVGISIVIAFLNVFLGKSNEKNNVYQTIESFAKVYYENTYYSKINSQYGDYYTNVLKEDEVNGIKLGLRRIIQIFDNVDAEIFYKKGAYCNFIETYAMIYPKYPYSKKDYKIEINMSCKKKI